MKCPGCRDLNNRVVDSRLGKDGDVIRRRRECDRCGRRFTTYERVEELMPMIVKKDGRRETFDRLKMMSGIKRACEKRPVAIDAMERTADEVERVLQEGGEKEVASSVIGEAVMRALRSLDQVAYVRFASVYRSFDDVDEFMHELKDLLKERRGTSRAAAGRKVARPSATGGKRAVLPS